MNKIKLLLLPLLFLAHPGIPPGCCGDNNCDWANTEYVQKGELDSIVNVNGINIKIPNSKIFTKDVKSGVYCWFENKECLDKLNFGIINEKCTACVGIIERMVKLEKSK